MSGLRTGAGRMDQAALNGYLPRGDTPGVAHFIRYTTPMSGVFDFIENFQRAVSLEDNRVAGLFKRFKHHQQARARIR